MNIPRHPRPTCDDLIFLPLLDLDLSFLQNIYEMKTWWWLLFLPTIPSIFSTTTALQQQQQQANMARWVVVSGSNRGVGMGICRQVLACDPHAHVVVTARQVNQAEAVREDLQQQYCRNADESFPSRVHAHALDVTDEASCLALADYVASQDGFHKNNHHPTNPPLTLVNNAGVAYDLPWFPIPWPAHAAAQTLQVNLWGAERLTRAFLPLLRPSSDGRVVNVSSGGGRANLRKMAAPNRDKLLDNETLTWSDVENMAHTFIRDYEHAATVAAQSVDDGDTKQLPFLSPSGFWLQSYGFSKACLGAYTQLLARQYNNDLLAVACSPGFIATDMSSSYPQYDTLKTIDEGGAFVAHLATADRSTLQNGVFYQPDKGVVPFVADA